MKPNRIFVCALVCSLLVNYLVSCKKTEVDPGTPASIIPDTASSLQAGVSVTGNVVMPVHYSMHCTGSPSYGDSVINPQTMMTNQDYIISPVNNPLPGRYFSWPAGLVINDSTGAINVTRSENGMRYYVGYVSKGTTDTCLNTLILGGASYLDSIYVQSNTKPSIAFPYFNANSNMTVICGPGPLGDCDWDLSDNAQHQHIIIDKKTGNIDLVKTMQAGAFGKVPVNGTTLTTNLYYHLGHPFQGAIQSLAVRIMYYDHLSSIPDSVKATINYRIGNEMGNTVLGSNPAKPDVRPPIVIIVRAN
jgi:hypothetical protein